MTASSELAALIGYYNEKNYNTRLLVKLTAKMESNSKKLEEQTNLYNKWEKEYDKGMDEDKEINYKGFHKAKGEVWDNRTADRYAHLKVAKYDEELLDELAELDMDYDAQKTAIEAAITLNQANIDSTKQVESTECQDTHLLGQ